MARHASNKTTVMKNLINWLHIQNICRFPHHSLNLIIVRSVNVSEPLRITYDQEHNHYYIYSAEMWQLRGKLHTCNQHYGGFTRHHKHVSCLFCQRLGPVLGFVDPLLRRHICYCPWAFWGRHSRSLVVTMTSLGDGQGLTRTNLCVGLGRGQRWSDAGPAPVPVHHGQQ